MTQISNNKFQKTKCSELISARFRFGLRKKNYIKTVTVHVSLQLQFNLIRAISNLFISTWNFNFNFKFMIQFWDQVLHVILYWTANKTVVHQTISVCWMCQSQKLFSGNLVWVDDFVGHITLCVQVRKVWERVDGLILYVNSIEIWPNPIL